MRRSRSLLAIEEEEEEREVVVRAEREDMGEGARERPREWAGGSAASQRAVPGRKAVVFLSLSLAMIKASAHAWEVCVDAEQLHARAERR